MKLSRRMWLIAVVGITIVVAVVIHWIYQETRAIDLVFAAGSKGGEYYAFGQALEEILERHDPRLRITLRESKGSGENMELLEQGDAQVVLAQLDTPTTPNVRSIASAYVEVFHLVLDRRLKAQSINDLKGRRIGIPLRGSGSYRSWQQLVAHYDLNDRDIQLQELTVGESHQRFRDRQIDGFFQVIGLGNAGLQQVIRQGQGELVGIDQAEAMRIALPYLEAVTIPRGTYQPSPPLPPADLLSIGVPSLILTHQRVEPWIMRRFTAILYEHRKDLVSLNPRTASIKEPSTGQNIGLPIHPGAQEYYDRERPSFLQENAEPIALVITVITLTLSGLWDLRSKLSERQKNRADAYNLEILSLIEQAHITNDVAQLGEIRNKLLTIFRKVIEDLDQDRLSPESYKLFIFPWEVAMQTVRDRETKVREDLGLTIIQG
ncbi:MAG: TAXI family TRAP transporter solute-binding subunit [Oscillatoriales cyanobacterium SM2_2_1]|nr:TAXI family TRAP transporter solute-binding subunit [Oscillatoriales cyanobacterium SM2_2_1]